MEIIEEGYIFSDQKDRVDVYQVHEYLSKASYWAKNIPFEIVRKSVENSLCFGIYQEGIQVGFARWVTDKATFAYLCDVYIMNAHRGKGLSKKLMSLMLFHPDLQDLRRYYLATKDAHKLYAQYGFKSLENPDQHMEIKNSNIYLNS